MKYGWRQGRTERKWKRRWRRFVRVAYADRRLQTHIRRYYNYPRQSAYWLILEYRDPEVRKHLLVCRLGGEGRFGQAWCYCPYQNKQVERREEGGPNFHVLVRGKFAKHAVGNHRWSSRWDWCELERRRHRADPYYKWTQRALCAEHEQETDT